MSDKTMMPVVVFKANIPLKKGETINAFTRKLSDEGVEHCFKKLNLVKTDDYVWMAEAFGDSAVFSVYKKGKSDAYYACRYKRDEKSGSFDFGDMSEVEKVVGYRPKSEMVQKNKGGLWENVI